MGLLKIPTPKISNDYDTFPYIAMLLQKRYDMAEAGKVKIYFYLIFIIFNFILS